MQKNKVPIFIFILIVILIFTVSMLFSGCGRRARIARALQEKEEESFEEQSIEDGITTEETDEVEDLDVEVSDEMEDSVQEETIETEETEEEFVEEPIEEVEGDQTEESEEELSEDEGVDETIDVLTACCESGYIEQGHGVVKNGYAIIGDNNENFQVKAFITFDISEYEGIDINFARIKFSGIAIDYGDPFELGPDLIINIDNYGELDPDDFILSGTHLYSEPLEGISEFTITGGNSNIKDTVQAALNDGQDYLQLRLECSKNTNDDDFADQLRFEFNNVKLRISY
jgi:hypothetical protein